mgnify:FL=1
MKKIIKFLIMFLLVISFSSINSKQANADSCSSGQTRCADTSLLYGVDKISSTNARFFVKGERIWFSWSNVSPGIFHTNIAIYNGTTKVYGYHSIPSLGSDYGYIPAPYSGSFHLVALCSDGLGETRCKGEGYRID